MKSPDTTPPLVGPQTPLFKTKDLQEATCLVVSGQSLRGVERGARHAFFIFPDSPDLQKILVDFYANSLRLNPRDIFSVWRGLRAMTYRAMEAEQGVEGAGV